jgi:hypothetical protein
MLARERFNNAVPPMPGKPLSIKFVNKCSPCLRSASISPSGRARLCSRSTAPVIRLSEQDCREMFFLDDQTAYWRWARKSWKIGCRRPGSLCDVFTSPLGWWRSCPQVAGEGPEAHVFTMVEGGPIPSCDAPRCHLAPRPGCEVGH